MEFEFNNVKVGKVVEGTVFHVSDDVCYVDIKAFADGVIYKEGLSLVPINSCKDVVKEGDVLPFKITKINHDDQRITLTRLDMLREENKEKFTEFADSNTRFSAKVVKITRGGLVLKHMGVELFMPLSQIAFERVEAEDFKGKTLECKVIENDGRKIVVSRKAILAEDRKIAKKKAFDAVNIGDKFEGTVVRVLDFGAFVSIGDVEGLVHRSEVSHFRFKNVQDVIKEGDKVTVEVISKEKNKIGLSMKKLLPTPWQKFAENNNVGDTVEGVIVRKMANGMLIEVEKEVVGMIGERDYSWNPRENLAGEVEVGDKLTLKILSMDVEKRRMALSKKHLDYNPWNDVSVKEGEEISGTVEEIQSRGALVTVQGVKAFLPISEISAERIREVSDALKIDDVINAVVLELDKREWRMKISIKALTEKKERAIFDKYKAEEKEVKKQTLGDLFKDKFDEFK